MTAETVRRVVMHILADIKRDPSLPGRLAPTTDLLSEVGLDSLELTEFILRIEDELEIEMDLEQFDVQQLRSLDRLVRFVAP
jgi:acyl carrier protein